MKRLFALAGVDYGQWKAISRTLLRSDLRLPGADTSIYSLRSIGGVALMVLTYGLFGLGAAVVIALNDDVLLTGIITLSYLSTLLTTSLLAQHTSAITAATDYAILAPRPVSSRTFLAVRLTNVLFHAALLTTLMAYPPIAAFTVAHGVSLARGLAAALALYGFAFAITFALVAVWSALLHTVGAARLNKVVSYAQMLVGGIAYGGVVLLLQSAGARVLASATMPREPWLLLVPPAWFVSYLEIAVGQADWSTWLRAALSIASLAALGAAMRGPLGRAYAERLGELSVTSVHDRAPEPRRGSWFFTRDEGRAVALLVRSHFRHDLRVRLGVLAIVPLTIIYMLMGLRDGGSADPFDRERSEAVDLVALAVLFFPTLIVQAFSGSESHRAAWIYFSTPASRGAIVLALKNVIVVSFFLPYVAFLGLLFTWQFENVAHALIHATFLALIGYLALQTGTLVEPRLPFALPPKKSVNSAAVVVWMLLAVVGGQLLLYLVVEVVYRTWWRIALAALLLGVTCALLDVAIRRRTLRRYKAFELG